MSFTDPEHSVIVHADQVTPEQLAAMNEQARAAGFEPFVDEKGFCLFGLTEEQADILSDGLRQIGVTPHGGVSYT